MPTAQEIYSIYEEMGGVFNTPLSVLQKKLEGIKAFIFDWDGVFNGGRKIASDLGSDFSESDSMGLNMLRFSMWLNNGKNIPPFAVITGENNTSSFGFSKRESFNQVYYKVPDKRTALQDFCYKNGVEEKEVAFFFDDILDLNTAKSVGLRCFLPRKNAPLFNSYVQQQELVDYQASVDGQSNGIREICELLIGLQNNFESVVQKRMQFEGDYKDYLDTRKSVSPEFFRYQEGILVKEHK